MPMAIDISKRFATVIAAVIAAGLSLALPSAAPALAAEAGPVEFSASPSKQLNAMWRVDTSSGALGYCFFQRNEGEIIGHAECRKPGEGAGPQDEPGPYGLEASNHETESGIFRVNRRSGTMSICYIRTEGNDSSIVCTAWAK